jgi:ribonuclease R
MRARGAKDGGYPKRGGPKPRNGAKPSGGLKGVRKGKRR